MYLLDTNIWLELMLDQERAHEAGRLLAQVPSERFLMTDFTLHSIGVILDRLNEHQLFLTFVQDVLIDGAVRLVSVPPESMALLVEVMNNFGLDFDDAYQYVATVEQSAILVSFDSGFDHTDISRVTPNEINTGS
jgi:uncharacterized protein